MFRCCNGWSVQKYRGTYRHGQAGAGMLCPTHYQSDANASNPCSQKSELPENNKEMLKQLEPKEILIYGNRLTELNEYKNIRWFEPYMNKFKKKVRS